VALHLEPESATNVTLRETVTDPVGRVVNTNEFLKDFFTTFKVNTIGKFTLTILNQGSSPVTVDGIFGYIPFVEENDQVNLSPFNALIMGVSLFIIGIIVMMVGVVFAIIDSRRKNRRPPPLTR
jgi:vacuolar-type H+-ATPase subunit I/STV1